MEKTEKGKVPRPHHSSDRSMDTVQGLGQALFAILTHRAGCISTKSSIQRLPSSSIRPGPALSSRNCTEKCVTCNPATSISRACFPSESTNPSQFQHDPCAEGTTTYWLAYGLWLGRAPQLPGCRQGSVIFCCAIVELGGAVLHLGEVLGLEPATLAQGSGKTSETCTADCAPELGHSP